MPTTNSAFSSLPPLATRLSKSNIAGLDIHSPLYIRLTNDPYGGGDIGSLYSVVDRMAEAGFSLLQLTPINDTGNSTSPYQGLGLFSYNPVFLNAEAMPVSTKIRKLLTERKRLVASRDCSDIVDYVTLRRFKLEVLRVCFTELSEQDEEGFEQYEATCSRHTTNYAIFIALLEKFGHSWPYWPEKYKHTEPRLIRKQHPELEETIRFWLYTQWVLENQWQDFAAYAQSKGIYIALDKPIYPYPDSADAWANKHLFYLNEDGAPRYVSGCNSPDDPFGEQVWGQAVYQYQEKPDEVVAYYLEQIGFLARIAPVIRLDHTLALVWKYYVIDPKIHEGHHLPALKHRLLRKIKDQFPEIYFIAEDVGYVSAEEVDEPLRQYNIPGLRCLQWLDRDRYTDTTHYPSNCVALTSNHDTQSLPSWWQHLSHGQKEKLLDELNKAGNNLSVEVTGADIVEQIFGSICNSPAAICMVTLRDIATDTTAYNTPGTLNKTNWVRRLPMPLEQLNFSGVTRAITNSGRNLQHRHNVPAEYFLSA